MLLASSDVTFSYRQHREGGDPALWGGDHAQPLRHPEDTERHGREKVPSILALLSYFLFRSGVFCPILAAWRASCSSLLGGNVRQRNLSLERVHSGRLESPGQVAHGVVEGPVLLPGAHEVDYGRPQEVLPNSPERETAHSIKRPVAFIPPLRMGFSSTRRPGYCCMRPEERVPKSVEEVRDRAAFVTEAAQSKDLSDYRTDMLFHQAMERNLVIGEAIGRVRLIHGHDFPDDGSVWSTVKTEVPVLLSEVEQLPKELEA